MTPRDTARAWLDDPLGVVLDFETTGWVGYAVEVAVVDMTGAEVLSMRLWPGDGVVMDAGALACHGIRLDDVRGLPTWADAWPHLRDALSGRLVVAYNATTERGVLAREALRCGSALGEREVVCAMQLWRRHLGQPRAVPLPGGDHSALGDARAALEVVRRVAGSSPRPPRTSPSPPPRSPWP